MANVVAVVGRLARPASVRELPSGDRLVSYEVSVERDGARAETVPVAWFEAPASAGDLDVGTRVLVVGRVRRRFFHAGGSLQSRTEVVADTVVPVTSAKRARAALARAESVLSTLLDGP